MEEQDYLIHYGVLGMKWGVRKAQKKGTNYSYTSMRTKSLTKRAANAKDKGKKNAGKLAEKAKISKQTDKKLLAYAKKTSTGKAVAQNLLLGPMGAKSYATMRSSGVSRKKAMASQIIAKSAGLALGAVSGGLAGSLVGKKLGSTGAQSSLNAVYSIMNSTGADFQTASRIVSKFANSTLKSSIEAGTRTGAVAGAVAGSTASVKKTSTKKKKKK